MKIRLVLAALVMTPMVHAMSLQEAMHTAFERNPRTQANDLRLKAMNERTRAAWMQFYPTFAVTYGYNYSQFDSSLMPEATQASTSSLTFSLGMNVFDGGVNLFNARAAEANQRAREAQYNSTNALIPNTKGAIADLVFNAYTDILRNRDSREYRRYVRMVLEKILKAAVTNEERRQVQGQLDGMDAEDSNAAFDAEKAIRDFEYVVKAPAPAKIENFSETIMNIRIPGSPDEALDIALEKSPELKVASYQLESMQFAYKSAQSSLHSPRVDVRVSSTRNDTDPSEGTSSNSQTNVVGLTVQWTFGASRLASNRAAALEIEAAQKDRDGELDQLQNKIQNIYPKIANYNRVLSIFERNYVTARKNLDDVIAQIDQGQNVQVSTALGLLTNLHMTWGPLIMTKQSLATTKFTVQKTIGTLFDQIETRAGRNNDGRN